MRYSVLGNRSRCKIELERSRTKTVHTLKSGARYMDLQLTLQQKGVCVSANIHFLDVVVRSDGVVTNDEPGDVVGCGDVWHCPRHSDVVRTHATELQFGGCWDD